MKWISDFLLRELLVGLVQRTGATAHPERSNPAPEHFKHMQFLSAGARPNDDYFKPQQRPTPQPTAPIFASTPDAPFEWLRSG